ncbi:MAG: DUF3710 domain-containing protein [Actinophytocola sp.]|nr:DUF3710 domain-containing protein [Actinophytocola sp.]
MGIFGRKGRGAVKRGRHALPEPGDLDYVAAEHDEPDDSAGPPDGPYDVEDAPDDDVARMDLGSVRVPVPPGAQVQVEMDQESQSVRAVHVVTPHGQATISAYAAPRTARLWPEVSDELAEQLRTDGGVVRKLVGEWGRELSIRLGDVSLFFVGADGPRWMLRGVIAGPHEVAAGGPEALRALVRDTIVVRGDGPMPVRNPLPVTLPEAIAEHIAQRGEQE